MKRLFLNFDDFASILGSGIFLFLKIILITYGLKLCFNKKKIVLLEIHHQFLKYRKSPQNRYDILHFYNELEKIEIRNIKEIALVKELFYKNAIQIKTSQETLILTGIQVLTLEEKREIVNTINTKINR